MPIADYEFNHYLKLLEAGPRYSQGSMDYVQPWLRSMPIMERHRVLDKLKKIFVEQPEIENYTFIPPSQRGDPRSDYLVNLSEHGVHFSDDELETIIWRAFDEKSYDFAQTGLYVYSKTNRCSMANQEFCLNIFEDAMAMLSCDTIGIATSCFRNLLFCNINNLFELFPQVQLINEVSEQCESTSNSHASYVIFIIVESLCRSPETALPALERLLDLVSGEDYPGLKQKLRYVAFNRMDFISSSDDPRLEILTPLTNLD